MREELVSLSNGEGRVPLSKFYSYYDDAVFQFTESIDYLRAIGALEEPAWGEPRVRLANYMSGPSNCIATSAFYSVCCISDCSHLMHEIEGLVKSPIATAAQLLAIVSNMSSSTVDAPRVLSGNLIQKLGEIASRHDGTIPIHGRLFAQWLHMVFPNECPYPALVEDVKVLSQQWALDDGNVVMSEQERAVLAQNAGTARAAWQGKDEMTWSEEEVLPLSEPKKKSRGLLSFLRALLFLAVGCVVLSTAGAAWRAAGQALSSKRGDAYGQYHAKDKVPLPF